MDETDIFRLESCRNACRLRAHLVCRRYGTGDRGLAAVKRTAGASHDDGGERGREGAWFRFRDKDEGGAAAPANGRMDSSEAAKTVQDGQSEPVTNAKEPVPSLDPAAAAGNGQAAETSPSSASVQAVVSPASSPTEAVGQPVSANEPPALTPSVPDPSGLINVNTADAATLMELPGIGEAKAKAIIDYRNQFGPFRTQADLMNVKGIGPKMLEKMKPYVGL